MSNAFVFHYVRGVGDIRGKKIASGSSHSVFRTLAYGAPAKTNSHKESLPLHEELMGFLMVLLLSRVVSYPILVSPSHREIFN